MATLCIQICPSPIDSLEAPFHKFGYITQRPDNDAEEVECIACEGTGKLFRDETCGKCSGKGKLKAITALRLFPDEKDLKKLTVDLLESLDNTYRVDRTIRLAESGGGLTNTGRANVVCGLHGEPLPSVWGRSRSNGTHAVFWVHAGMLISFAHRRGNGSGTVTFYGIDRTAPQWVGIHCVELWEFSISASDGLYDIRDVKASTMPTLKFPTDAVMAAWEKSCDYHCRSAYYVASGYAAHGPSGALRGAGAAFGGLPSPVKGPGIGYEPTAP